jgi:hypothetical protein
MITEHTSACGPGCPVCRIAELVQHDANGPVPPVSTGTDLASGDWDLLMGAVKERLEHEAVLAAAARAKAHGDGALHRALGAVLECVTALDQLHASLAYQRRRRDAAAAAPDAFIQAPGQRDLRFSFDDPNATSSQSNPSAPHRLPPLPASI